jgi:hypothetical protein
LAHFTRVNKYLILAVAYNKFYDFAELTKFYDSEEEARNDYDTYLFHFREFQILKTDNVSKITEVLLYDPKLIRGIPVIKIQPGEDVKEVLNKTLSYDLVILRDALPTYGLNPYIFSTDYLNDKYPESEIEIIEQSSNFFGFTKNIHERKHWRIKQFLNYIHMKKADMKIPDDFLKELGAKKDQIYFGVNIDMDNMLSPCRELKTKLPSTYAFGSFDDALSYVREPIRGMTIPQYYIKEDGVWTGGHEENLRIRSININHGNEVSEWYGVGAEGAEKFHQHISNNEKIDIYQREGLWYVNYEYFLKNKIKVIYGIQQPSDIMIVGPGCIHWVRSRGHSLHTSWNFCSKDLAQLKCCHERYKLNKSLGQRNLVPLITLFIDLINFELNNLDLKIVEFIYEILRTEFDTTEEEYGKLKDEWAKQFTRVKEMSHQNALVCDYCFKETFQYWGLCTGCDDGKNQGYNLTCCVNCFPTHFSRCKNNSFILYYKYEKPDIRILFERIEARLNTEGLLEDDLVQFELTKPIDEFRNSIRFKIEYLKDKEKDLTDGEKTVLANYIEFEKRVICPNITSEQSAKLLAEAIINNDDYRALIENLDNEQPNMLIEINEITNVNLQDATATSSLPDPKEMKHKAYLKSAEILEGMPQNVILS